MKERYESYKDSGVPWIGQVPQGWEVRRLKSCISIKTDKGSPTATSSYVGMENIVSWDMKYVPTNIEVEGQASFFNAGDILFGKLRPYLAKVWKCEFDGSCSTEFLVMQAKCADFIKYLLVSKPFIDVVNSSTYGAKMPRANSDFIMGLYIPLPPLSEQEAIAGYLDARCAAIDAYVASLEREAALARELKQAVIARAVTRGLDPNTPMRDSGIPWIGQVPKGWEVVRVKHYLKITNGCDPTTEGDVPVYGSGSTSFKTCGEYKKGPTVLLGRKGTINIPQYVEGKYWNVDTAFDVKSKGGFDLKLFYYMATCFDYESYMTQTAVPSMAQSDYNNIKIPLPPLSEQHAIAVYLDARCAAIDAYVASLEREAALARELKQREIADAVTGKVKITA